ncbi:MAG: nucleotide pyrophosphatase/phosphodiesterase family protein [Burkholderiaceae bacterium]
MPASGKPGSHESKTADNGTNIGADTGADLNANPGANPKTRVLMVVFDALRPDMVSEQLMPNLARFANNGVRYTRSRCVFPSETRVNQSSLITGCYPGRHGIVANQFVEPTASPEQLFNTGNEDILREGDKRLNGKLLLVPSLGERLAAQQLQLATISSGTPGGGRILNHRAEQTGGFRLAMHRPDATTPPEAMPAIEQRIGAIPKADIPSLSWLRWATDAWMQYVESDVRWDVGIVWFCEPDSSYHYCGIGSPENLGAIAAADAEFGRLLDFYASAIEAGELQVITLSDHGQLGVTGEPVDIATCLQAAGLSTGPVPGPNVDVAISVDSAGGIFCRDHDPELIARVVDCLAAQPWCGVVATANPNANPMGISLRDLRLDGSRAPDVAVVLSAGDEPGPHDWPGTSRHDAHYPIGGGIHGGLHPIELHNWMAMGGKRFRGNVLIDAPAGIVDVLPTVMALVGGGDDGLTDDGIDGRVLTEALSENAVDLVGVTQLIAARKKSTRRVGFERPQLAVTHFDTAYYLDGMVGRDDDDNGDGDG